MLPIKQIVYIFAHRKRYLIGISIEKIKNCENVNIK